LGYVPDQRELRVVHPGPDGYSTGDEPARWWRCLNHAWGCNWMVARDGGDVWCASCRLTRGRPDLADPDAVAAWAAAEGTKRRLVHQLLDLGLPLEPASPHAQRLVFDLLAIHGAGATGHHEGVVTLDLREVDDAYRDELRRRLHEPFRTVIGHLRHEAGHHYWHVLVTTAETLARFRRLFGDERADYRAALDAHYGTPPAAVSAGHVSHYAMAHPAEDWAETFAHYLHLRDGLETAAERGLGPDPDPEAGIDALLDAWQSLVDGVNDIIEGLGQPAAYPFRIGGRAVADKFAFVHRLITAAAGPGPAGARD
jgi:hypothetical protein